MRINQYSKLKMKGLSIWQPYQKKPIIIYAAEWSLDEPLEIETLEGVLTAQKGDMIIQGINGELYPCKPDIFEKTYNHV